MNKEDYLLVTDLMSPSAAAQCLENEECFKVDIAAGMTITQGCNDVLYGLFSD